MDTGPTFVEQLSSFRDTGYAVFRGGTVSAWVLEMLAEACGGPRGVWGRTPYAIDFSPDAPPVGNSIGQSSAELPLHTDGTFDMDPTPAFLMQCIEADETGYGLTTIVDGWRVVSRLTPGTLATLQEVPFRFYRADKGKEATLMAPILSTVETRYALRYRNDRKHPLTASCEEGRVALEEFVGVVGDRDMSVTFQLWPGDVLLLDNHRMLHGRTALSGQRRRTMRRIWVQPNLSMLAATYGY